ncbi:MAG: THUMP-like domain-containing protein [Lacipirellulaceae bacterium]
MDPLSPTDVRWLLSDAGERAIAEAAEIADPLRAIERLRKSLDARRAAHAVEQAELRTRATAKFRHAATMLFTKRGLEQATDEWIAAHKAARFARLLGGDAVADLCCGVGGDLCGFAALGVEATGIDRDAALSAIANHNASQYASRRDSTASATVGEAGADCLRDHPAWHADPDRRPGGTRTTRPELHDPPLEALAAWRDVAPNAAVKLAPAARLPDDWTSACELEWISRGGECRQQVAWCGGLAESPGRRRATRVVVSDEGASITAVSFAATPSESPETRSLGTFVYDPDPAVMAAGLAAALASKHSLTPVADGVAYFSGDGLVAEPLLAPFAVEEVMPLDAKRLGGWLSTRGVGRLEVKVRGGVVDPERLRASLKPRGDDARTLLVYPDGKRMMVIVARRVEVGRP